MAIKVKQFSVRTGDRTYFPGEIVSGLDKAEEKRLVELGYCEYAAESESVKDAAKNGSKGKGKNRPNDEDIVENNDLLGDDGDGPNTGMPI